MLKAKQAPNEFYAIKYKNKEQFLKTSIGKYSWMRIGHAKLALHSYIRKFSYDIYYSKELEEKYLRAGYFMRGNDGITRFIYDGQLHEVASKDLYQYLLDNIFEIVKAKLCIFD